MDSENYEKTRKSLKTMKVLTVVFAVITVISGVVLGGLVLEKILKGAPGGQVEINQKRIEALKSFLGAQVMSISESIAEELNFGASKGVLVSEVVESSPADKAGLERGDLVIRFDGQKVTDVQQLQNFVAETSPGDMVKMVVKRSGMNKALYIRVGGINNEQIALASSSPGDASAGGKGSQARTSQKSSLQIAQPDSDGSGIFHVSMPGSEDSWGMSVSGLAPDIEQKYGLADKKGTLVVEVRPGGKAETAGLMSGDLITSVNNRETPDLPAFYSAISGRTDVLLDVYSQGENEYVTMKVDPETPPVAVLGTSISEEKEKRIAVAADGPGLSSQVAARFGTASYFLVLDPQGPTLLRSIPNPVLQEPDYRGFGIRVVQLLGQEHIEAVITGGIGPQAFDALALSDIKIFSAQRSGAGVAEVIQLYNQNELVELLNPTLFGTGYGRGLPIPLSQTSASQIGGQKTQYALVQGGPPIPLSQTSASQIGGQKTQYALVQGGPPGQTLPMNSSASSNYTALQGQPQQGTANRVSDCVCPQCGYVAPHQIGVPCFTMTCPRCGSIMVRADRLIGLTGGKPEQIPPVGRPDSISYSPIEYSGVKPVVSSTAQTSVVKRTADQRTAYTPIHSDSDDEEKQKGKDKDDSEKEGYQGRPPVIPPMGSKEQANEANVVNIWQFGGQPLESQPLVPDQIPPSPQEQYRYPVDQPRYPAQVPIVQSQFPSQAPPLQQQYQSPVSQNVPPVRILEPGTFSVQQAASPQSLYPGLALPGDKGSAARVSGNVQPATQIQAFPTVTRIGTCYCPYCGTVVNRPAGIPCAMMTCPNCGSRLINADPGNTGAGNSPAGRDVTSGAQAYPTQPYASQSIPPQNVANPNVYYGTGRIGTQNSQVFGSPRPIGSLDPNVGQQYPVQTPEPYVITSADSENEGGRGVSTIRPEDRGSAVSISLEQPKIAIPVDAKKLSSNITGLFDNAPYFLIMSYGSYRTVSNPNARDKIGSGAQTAQFLIGEGVGIVIADNISLEALRTLKELKVTVYTGVSGKAEEAIEWYQSGRLTELSPVAPDEEGKHDSSDSNSRGKGPREDKQRL